MLHLGDQGLLGPRYRFITIGERDLQPFAPGLDEMSLHADSILGIIEPVGANHDDRSISGWTPRLAWCPIGDEFALVGVSVARWKTPMTSEA